MTLDQLLKKYGVELDKETRVVTEQGIEIMKNSSDDTHDIKHVLRLYDNLDNLLSTLSKEEIDLIQFDVLIPAIAWHDTWKSERFPKGSLSAFLFDQMLDGIGSFRKFRKYILQNHPNFDPSKRRHIELCILQHGGAYRHYQKPNSLESKILYDIDEIDIWSNERVESAAEKYLNDKFVNTTTRRIVDYFFKYYILKRSPKRYYFEWTRVEHAKRKEPVAQNIKKKLKKMDEILSRKIG